jgi:hypothetical protein
MLLGLYLIARAHVANLLLNVGPDRYGRTKEAFTGALQRMRQTRIAFREFKTPACASLSRARSPPHAPRGANRRETVSSPTRAAPHLGSD